MSLLSLIGFGPQSGTPSKELPKLFPLNVLQGTFTEIDIVTLYKRILIDVLERTYGLTDDEKKMMQDNCVGSETGKGLVTLLAEAMFNKQELFLVYKPEFKTITTAEQNVQTQIRADYKKQGFSALGVYVNFKNYSLTDMLIVYSVLEYCTVHSLNKGMNLSTAIQLKISNLRGSIATGDSDMAVKQAVEIASALSKGQDVMMDAADEIETATVDMTATEKAMAFIDRKKSFYVGLPANYITGSSSPSMGDTGEKDAKAIERGLKHYYFSIVEPVLEVIFSSGKNKKKLEFKSEDYYGLSTAVSTLQTFEITSDELISHENKQSIVNKLFGLPENAKGDEAKVVNEKRTEV